MIFQQNKNKRFKYLSNKAGMKQCHSHLLFSTKFMIEMDCWVPEIFSQVQPTDQIRNSFSLPLPPSEDGDIARKRNNFSPNPPIRRWCHCQK